MTRVSYASGDVSATNALNNTTTFTYDTRGELLAMTNARGKVTTLAYDTKGNVSQTTDALANVTKFAYDARGRVIARLRNGTVSGATSPVR